MDNGVPDVPGDVGDDMKFEGFEPVDQRHDDDAQQQNVVGDDHQQPQQDDRMPATPVQGGIRTTLLLSRPQAHHQGMGIDMIAGNECDDAAFGEYAEDVRPSPDCGGERS